MGDIGQRSGPPHFDGNTFQDGPRTIDVELDASCQALHEARVSLCGVTEARAPYFAVRAEPAFAAVVCTVSGVGQVWLDGKWQLLERGAVLVLPSRVPHAYGALQSGVWRLAWLAVFPPYRPLGHKLKLEVKGGPSAPLEDAILALHRELVGRRDARLLRLHALRVRREGELLVEKSEQDPVVWETFEHVARELNRAWSLEELARTSGYRPERLRQRCIERYGESPMARVRSLRLEQARLLLAQEECSLDEIAARVGYADRFALSRAYRKHFGASPRGS